MKNPFLGLKCVFCEVECMDPDAHVAEAKHKKWARQAIYSSSRLCEEGANLWKEGIEVMNYKFDCATCGMKGQEWWQLYGLDSADHVHTNKHKAALKKQRREDATFCLEARQRRWDAEVAAAATNITESVGPSGGGAQGRRQDVCVRKQFKSKAMDDDMKGWGGCKPRDFEEAWATLHHFQKMGADMGADAKVFLLRLCEEKRMRWLRKDTKGVSDIWLEKGGADLEIALRLDYIEGHSSVRRVKACECVQALFPESV